MTDTVRSFSALQALLADNASGAISEQDVRDFLASVLGVLPYAAKSASYTATEDDCVIGVTTGSSADVTITLPPVATTRVGKQLLLIKVDSGNKNIVADGNASETINGATTKTVTTQWSGLRLINTGAAWLGSTITGA